jgi:hypothetical protein
MVFLKTISTCRAAGSQERYRANLHAKTHRSAGAVIIWRFRCCSTIIEPPPVFVITKRARGIDAGRGAGGRRQRGIYVCNQCCERALCTRGILSSALVAVIARICSILQYRYVARFAFPTLRARRELSSRDRYELFSAGEEIRPAERQTKATEAAFVFCPRVRSLLPRSRLIIRPSNAR